MTGAAVHQSQSQRRPSALGSFIQKVAEVRDAEQIIGRRDVLALPRRP